MVGRRKRVTGWYQGGNYSTATGRGRSYWNRWYSPTGFLSSVIDAIGGHGSGKRFARRGRRRTVRRR
jgi:hypothetical protein